MRVLVCGCGRIGSPMLAWLAHYNRNNDAVELAGVDVDKSIQGPLEPRFKEQGWEEIHSDLVSADKVPPILSYNELHYPFDVVLITCGTPIDRNQNPDTTQVFAAIDSLVSSGAITDDTLLVMRSTLFPGCTRLIRKRLRVSYNLFPAIVMAPERIAEGFTFAEIDQIPQIIGGDESRDIERASYFFQKIFGSKQINFLNPEDGGSAGAELAKLFCNTFRYVNFGLGNEFAIICDENEVDYNAVRNACNTHYWRSNIAGAALNLGGPCLGKDAKTLAAFTTKAKITEAAYDVAEKTVLHYINKHKHTIRNANIVGVLGLAFKRNSDNPMNSLSYKLINTLEILGVNVLVHDPEIPHHLGSTLEAVAALPVVFVMTEHDEYKELLFGEDQVVVRL